YLHPNVGQSECGGSSTCIVRTTAGRPIGPSLRAARRGRRRASRRGWNRPARQLLVERRRLVNERGHDDGGLLQVVGRDAVEDVLVGVVGAGLVLDGVLDELEGGQADAVERLVIGAERAGGGERRGAQVAEGLEPAAEDGADAFVALGIDAADLAG